MIKGVLITLIETVKLYISNDLTLTIAIISIAVSLITFLKKKHKI